ncbi:MAG: hypothetical protein ACE5GN_01785 [Waddliaceae bacterium]
MSKDISTGKKIQESIASEIKRTQDIEQELNRLQLAKQGESEESQIVKFKRLVLTFKKKYQQALQELAKKENSPPLGTDPIVKKYQDAQEENASLIAQQASLKEMLHKTQEELGAALQTISDSDPLREIEENSSKLKEKLQHAEEVVANLVNENRQYKELLGDFGQDQPAIAPDREQIEALEKRCEMLESEKKELSEKVWLIKEEQAQSKNQRGNTDLEEVALLRQQLARSNETIHNQEELLTSLKRSLKEDARKEAEVNKTSLQQLQREKELAQKALEESRRHGEQLERAVTHLRTKSEEYQMDAQALEKEFQESCSQIESLNKDVSRLRKNIEDYNKSLMDSEKQKDELEHELKETKQQREKLEKELEAMKQTLVQGLRETKEIKQHYHNLANEKAASIQRNRQMQQHLQELKAEIQLREDELKDVRAQVEEARAEREKIEKHLQLERDKQTLFERKMQERDDNITSFSEQIKTMQHKLKTAEEIAKEKDHCVLEAQQHLAKKVREASQLNETLERQNRQIATLQENLIDAKAKVTETQSKIESCLENQQKLQKQLDAKEEKYARTYERFLEVEAQNKELRKIQEKHEEMQQLLSNLGNVIGSPVGFTRPSGGSSEYTETPKPKTSLPEEVEESPPKSETSPQEVTLFDQQKPPIKYKKDLFE